MSSDDRMWYEKMLMFKTLNANPEWFKVNPNQFDASPIADFFTESPSADYDVIVLSDDEFFYFGLLTHSIFHYKRMRAEDV